MNAAANAVQTGPQAQGFNYNPEEAQAADQGQRIDQSGAYVGIFTKFKWKVAQSGAAGYEFDFESTSGQLADRLTIYTINSMGQPIDIGRRKMSALLCCMSVGSIVPRPMNIKESIYNEQTSKYEDEFVMVDMFPEAINKPIGIILQMEDYTGNDGVDRRRLNYLQAFRAQDRRNAREMFEAQNAQKAGSQPPAPSHVDEVLGYLTDKDSRKAPEQHQAAPQHQAGGQPSHTQPPVDGFADMDDLPY